jgi:hypothetical protein
MEVSGQRHAPAALYPQRKDPPVPVGQEAGWASELVWTQRLQKKSFAFAGDRTPVFQSVVRHYKRRKIRVHLHNVRHFMNIHLLNTSLTEGRDRVLNIRASYPGSSGFRSWPGDKLSWPRVSMVCLSPSRHAGILPSYYTTTDSFRSFSIHHLLPSTQWRYSPNRALASSIEIP